MSAIRSSRSRSVPVTALAICSLSGCVTLSGTYVVSATDADGRDLSSNLRMAADGSHI